MKKTFLSIILALVIGISIGSFLPFQHMPVKSLDENNEFLSILDKISNHDFEGYTNIFNDQEDNIVIVPNSIAGRQDKEPDGLYKRQKHYIFKGDNNIVIMMSVSAIQTERQIPEWHHAIGYFPKVHNAPEGRYQDSFNDELSASEVYQYAFVGNGYAISITAISSVETNEGIYSLSMLAQFVDQLAPLLNNE